MTTPVPESDRKKVFLSYTGADHDWAMWIGCTLRDAGHTPFVHEWELGPGGNIPAWMEKRLAESDRAIGVFSDAYCGAFYSTAERHAAIWSSGYGASGFYVPIEVEHVAKWPVFTAPLSRVSLVDLDEATAEARLLDALRTPAPPATRPAFPGHPSKAPGRPDATLATRTIASGAGSIAIGGNVVGAVIVAGNGNVVAHDARFRLDRAAALADVLARPSEPLPDGHPTLPKKR